LSDYRLLLGHHDERSILPDLPPKRCGAAEKAVPLTLVQFHVEDAFSDTVALSLGNGGEDREHQLRYPVAGNVATEVDLRWTPIVRQPEPFSKV
jgi:hypothetical protein